MRWKLLSWNVNGIRAAEKKGFAAWLGASGADVVAVQETKARPEQLSEALLHPPGYYADWNSAEKKGYSGVAIYSKQRPLKVTAGLGESRFDSEGRVLIHEFEPLVFLNTHETC
jgi:exodeoxyribonuclease-3